MSFNKHFQDELAYLRELGREFANANPKLAPFLADSGNDPDVERLLEGFAFLSGRIRQKLDDELPELTHSLISLLWPHYLRPIPAMSVLQFEPVPSAISGPALIPRGVEVDSIPVEGTPCRFRTCSDVRIAPISVSKASMEKTPGGAVLRLGFALQPGSSFERVELDTVRLHLHGDPVLTKILYLWLFRYLERVRVRLGGGTAGDDKAFILSADQVRPVGFADDEGLLPYPPSAFSAYRLLQEYFVLPEKFLFLDIGGLGPLTAHKMADHFELAFEFSRAPEEQVRPKAENFRLHCTPIVNLFRRDADPIRVDQTKSEYRIRPAGKEPSHFELYSIDQVEGWVQGTGKRRLYRPFESFEHGTGANGEGAVFYRSRVRPAVVGRGLETYISFVSAGDTLTIPPTEMISMQTTCTNRSLPEKLRAGDIATPTGSSPEFAKFRNLFPPRPSVAPPLDSGLHWQLIANMSLNYVSLLRVEALRTVLSAYDFQARYDRKAERESQLRLEGIVGLETKPVDLLRRGLPVRGLRTNMEMRESNFAGEGDMYLFATVLNEFLSLFASINSFHELIVTGLEHGETYRWPAKSGQQLVL